ncbi:MULTISPECIES: hypothetical protein [unclassified Parafrankia]|nr:MULTISPECIES: hypothetical protein [unclassified Parafrankia]SQD93562.1 hypothetical protein FMEAI12_1730005 [Parafrankia sp. Ea1.12]
MSGAAFAGGLLTLGAVLLLGRHAGRIDPAGCCWQGWRLGYLSQAATSFL